MLHTSSIEVSAKRTKETHDEAACQAFGERLTAAMIKKAITQAEVGRALGVSRSAVNWWTNGKTYPSIDKVRELAALLHTTPEWLLFGLNTITTTSAQVNIPLMDYEDAVITLPSHFMAKVSTDRSRLQGLTINTGGKSAIAITDVDDLDVGSTPKMMVMKGRNGKPSLAEVKRSDTKTGTVLVTMDNHTSKEVAYKRNLFVGSVAAMVETRV